MSDLVGNPEDRFSHNEAQLRLYNLRVGYRFELSEDSRSRGIFYVANTKALIS